MSERCIDAVEVVPGVAYSPAEQTVYIDVEQFSTWVGVSKPDLIGESLLLAAVRATKRQGGIGKVRQYIIRGA